VVRPGLADASAPRTQQSDLTPPRQWWSEIKARPNRAKFGVGGRPAIVNIDMQRAHTDIDSFATAYQTDPGCRIVTGGAAPVDAR
jgi:hypothetical protein